MKKLVATLFAVLAIAAPAQAQYRGDIRLGDTIDFKFTTVDTSGVPTNLSSGAVECYPDNSATQITAGITLSGSPFDTSVVGLNNVRVVATSGNGYATSTNYECILSAGTVSGTSVVGYVVGSFSIEKRSAVMPTTAARTLDVSAAGDAEATIANVASQGGSTASLTLASLTIAPAAGGGSAVTITGGAASGATPAGHALNLTGGAASTTGGGTAGRAITATGGAGAASTNGAAEGVRFIGGGTNTVASFATGFHVQSTSVGHGFAAVGTGSGEGVSIANFGTGHGLELQGGSDGHALLATGGAVSGNGIRVVSPNEEGVLISGGGGPGLAISGVGGMSITASSNGHGISIAGSGSGEGISVTGGATGHGAEFIGGATSGNGIRASGTAGNSAALNLTGQGSAAGLLTTGGATGNGATFAGGATSGHGAQFTTVGSNEIDGDRVGTLTGNITGSLSGSVGSVTGNVGGNVSGSVGSVTGNVGGNVTGSVGSIASGGITAASFGSGAIDATAIAADAIGPSELATDAIGSAEFAQAAADKVWSTTIRALTDKAGFALSATGTDLTVPSALVVTDGGNSTTQAKTDRTETDDDYWKDSLILFNGTCNIAGQVAKITDYNGTTKILTWAPAKTDIPDDGCGILILNR